MLAFLCGYWMSNPDISTLSIDEHLKHVLLDWPKKYLPPIKDQLHLIESETEIIPGIQAIAAPGHTPGHMALLISSDDQKLLHLADTVIHPIHIEYPEWNVATDINREQTLQTRNRQIDWAAKDEMLVSAYHFPFPGLGYVQNYKNKWKWESTT